MARVAFFECAACAAHVDGPPATGAELCDACAVASREAPDAFDCWCCVTSRAESERTPVPGLCADCFSDVGAMSAWDAYRLAVREGDAPARMADGSFFCDPDHSGCARALPLSEDHGGGMCKDCTRRLVSQNPGDFEDNGVCLWCDGALDAEQDAANPCPACAARWEARAAAIEAAGDASRA